MDMLKILKPVIDRPVLAGVVGAVVLFGGWHLLKRGSGGDVQAHPAAYVQEPNAALVALGTEAALKRDAMVYDLEKTKLGLDFDKYSATMGNELALTALNLENEQFGKQLEHAADSEERQIGADVTLQRAAIGAEMTALDKRYNLQLLNNKWQKEFIQAEGANAKSAQRGNIFGGLLNSAIGIGGKYLTGGLV